MPILFRLARYGIRLRRQLCLAWISLIASSVLALALPRLIGDAVDHALTANDNSELYWLAGILIFLSVLRGGFSYGQTYFAEAISAMVAYTLRNALLSKMQRLSFGFHDTRNTGDLMSVVTYDVESTRMFISFGLVRFFQLAILFLGIIPLLMLLHWQLGLISLAGVPVTLYTTVTVGKKLRVIWNRVQIKMGELTTVLQENLAGIRVVKSFGAESAQQKIFHVSSSSVSEETYKANRLRVSNSAFLTFMYIGATGLVILFGGQWVIDGSLSPGELTQFLLYLGLLVMPVRMLGWAVNTFSRAMSSGERIFQILDSESPVQPAVGAQSLDNVKGDVRFHDVSFRYNPLSPGLNHISFEVAAGQRIAILGAAGSGKSTVVNLIPRFYDPTDGIITIDGVDIREVTLESLRDNVGIVFQDVFLFFAPIRENIAYGAKNVTFAQVEEAAKAAQLHDFILTLPEGYDTVVGERGVTLSGGQRQRLAIARTMLVDPPVLILDDSTSSVDVETERLITAALDTVMRDRTTFIIAHRVSSVQEADMILVLEDGMVVERGTHSELINRDGFYRRIYELQLLPSEQVLFETPFTGVSGG